MVLIPATTSINSGDAINAALVKGDKKKSANKKKNNKKKKKSKKGDNIPLATDVTTTVSSLFGDQDKLVWIAIVVAIVISHSDNVSSGFLGSYLTKDQGPLATWVLDNTKKTMGLMCFLPLVASVAETKRFKVVLASLVGVLAAPPLSLTTYAAMALATYVALHVQSKRNRMYIIGIMAYMAYNRVDLSNLLGFMNSPVPAVTSRPQRSPPDIDE